MKALIRRSVKSIKKEWTNLKNFFPKDKKDKKNEIDYPFTGLGYTYDWGKPSPVGPSEFVIEASPNNKVTVEVESVTSTKDYCKNNKISAPE
jgi:hypothetical protein